MSRLNFMHLVVHLVARCLILLDWLFHTLLRRRLHPLTEETLWRHFNPDERRVILSDHLTTPWWYEGFTLLLKCYREDRALTASGRMLLQDRFVEILQNRLAISRRLPSVDLSQCPIKRPIFIIGANRTGTTFLQNLLYQDPQNTSPRYYEVMCAVGEQGRAGEEDPRISKQNRILDAAYKFSPIMRVIHIIEAEGPYECYHLFDNIGLLKGCVFLGNNNFSYEEWIWRRSADEIVEAYRFHKLQVQLALLNRKPGDGQHLQLIFKDSIHSQYLEAILKIYPDALFVHTYRDPYDNLGSLCSIYEHYNHIAYSPKDVDLKRIGRGMLRSPLLHGGREMMAFRNAHPEMEHRFCDIAFRDIVSSPMSVVKKIYDHFGKELTSQGESRMRRYVEEHPQNKYGRHNYNLQRYHVTKDEIVKQFEKYVEFSEKRC